jgi:hypothetical protein
MSITEQVLIIYVIGAILSIPVTFYYIYKVEELKPWSKDFIKALFFSIALGILSWLSFISAIMTFVSTNFATTETFKKDKND